MSNKPNEKEQPKKEKGYRMVAISYFVAGALLLAAVAMQGGPLISVLGIAGLAMLAAGCGFLAADYKKKQKKKNGNSGQN